MSERKLGDILDGLGVAADLDEDDLIESAVVLLKVIDQQGQVSLHLANSAGCDWIEQAGMVDRARAVLDLPGVDDD